MTIFNEEEATLLSLDNYYRPREQQPIDAHGFKNFDLPTGLEIDRFLTDLDRLLAGEDIHIREYTFNNPNKKPSTIFIRSSPILVVEGLFTFHFEDLRKLLDLKVFIDTPPHLMLSRRIQRDAEERGYDLQDVLYRFEHHVMPAYRDFIEPHKSTADLIVPNHGSFTKSLQVLTAFLQSHLTK